MIADDHLATGSEPSHAMRRWWRSAVIYQVYPRSFADGNGDGVGDLAGIRARLAYLRDLGVDAIWFSPWYPSPMADAGYDVADYRDIDPAFGTLAEAEALIAEAHAAGHPDHRRHRAQPLLRRAPVVPGGAGRRAAARAARELFWFRDGRGEHGELPPNDWASIFGGPAWTRVARRAVVPAPVRPRAARLQLGQPEGARGVRGHPAVLVRPRRRRHPHRLGRAAASRTRRCPTSTRTRRRSRTRTPTATRPRRSTGRWRRVADALRRRRGR